MIRGLGMDVVEIERIARLLARFGQRFVQKILTPEEERALARRGLLGAGPQPHAGGGEAAHATAEEAAPCGVALASAVAARFAAKEAAVKALGTGFAHGIGPHHIEIHSLPSGQPQVLFHGPAARRMAQMGAARAHISLTHSRETAAAVVILEA